ERLGSSARGQAGIADGNPPPLVSRPAFEQPHIIYPSAVYTVEDLRRFFGLKATSVRCEVRLGRLRIAKRCGRYYCLGQWVLQWLGEGELETPAGPREATVTSEKGPV